MTSCKALRINLQSPKHQPLIEPFKDYLKVKIRLRKKRKAKKVGT
jgi:hypothetical protein